MRALIFPLVLVFGPGAGLATGDEIRAEEVDRFGNLPARFNGRVTTLADFAVNMVRQIGGREDVLDAGGKAVSATRWLLDGLCAKAEWGDYRLYAVEDEEVLRLLDLPDMAAEKGGAVYSPRDLLSIEEHERRIREIPEGERTDLENSTFELAKRLRVQMTFMRSVSSPMGADLKAAEVIDFIERIESRSILRPVPGRGGGHWDSLPRSLVAKAVDPGSLSAAGGAFLMTLGTYIEGDADKFRAALDRYEDLVFERGKGAPFGFEVPEGWVEVGSPSEMKANYYGDALRMGRHVSRFEMWDGEEFIELNIHYFDGPVAPVGQYLNHWRGGHQLMPLSSEDVDEGMQAMPVGDFAGFRMDVVAPDNGLGLLGRSLAWVLQRGETTVVVTLFGPKDRVGVRAEDTFDSFLTSLRIGEREALVEWFGEIPEKMKGIGWSGAVAAMNDDGGVWVCEFIDLPEKFDEFRNEFLEFVGTLELEDGGADGRRLHFDVLDGWEPVEGDPSNYAEFEIRDVENSYPPRVVVRWLEGTWDSGTGTAFLNDRMGKVREEAIDEQRYADMAKRIEVGGKTVVIVEFKTGGKTAKFEGDLELFLGEAEIGVEQVFDGGRFPNITVANDGTLLAVFGKGGVRLKRSEDGGKTWGEEIVIAESGFMGGGVTVDEGSGGILAFIEERHPPAPLTVYRSKDHGKTWVAQETAIELDAGENEVSMHMNETGITLRHGKHAGRLIRPSRFYAGKNDKSKHPEHFTNAIFSDDGGKTWKTSAPFPKKGTGEACIVELSDGRLYYNTRRHWAPEGENPLRRWTAWSEDGGATWKDVSICEVLPDGDQDRSYGLMGGLVRLPVAGKDVLVFSNIVSPGGRHHGTVWASFDGGKSWPVRRLVTEGAFGYSSMAAGNPGTPGEGKIYLMFESGGAKVATFNLSWLVDGEPTGDGEVPNWVRGE